MKTIPAFAVLSVLAALNASCAATTAQKRPAEPPSPIEGETQRRVAYHEAGHAVIAAILRPKYPVTDIVVRAQSSEDSTYGATHHSKIARLETVEDIIDEAVEDMAGREAEVAILGKPTNGGTFDMINAYKLFRGMCCLSGLCGSPLIEEEPSADSKEKISRCLNLARAHAKALVAANVKTIEDLGDRIMSQPARSHMRMLSGEQLRAFLKGRRLTNVSIRDPAMTCP